MSEEGREKGFDAARGWRFLRFMLTSPQGLIVLAISIALAVIAPSPVKLLPLFLGLAVIFGFARKKGMVE
jgi:hypothetical protein